jgi:hypothetical protein
MRLVLGTTLWQHAKMATILKSPKQLKNLECKKGQPSSRPPIPHVPATDLVTTKESTENLMIKLPNGTVFNMSIFFQGSTKESLCAYCCCLMSHHQKGLEVQHRKLSKTVDKLAGTLENLLKPNGPKDVSSKKNKKACKSELGQTQEMLKEAWKAHTEAVAKTHKLLRNLQSGDPQSQWDWGWPQDAQGWLVG